MRMGHFFGVVCTTVLTAFCCKADETDALPGIKASLFPKNEDVSTVESGTLVKTGVVAVNSSARTNRFVLVVCDDALIGLNGIVGALGTLAHGTVVRITGKVGTRYDDFCKFLPTSIERIGPPARISTCVVEGARIANGAVFGECVETRGFISSAWRDDTSSSWNWLTLWTDLGPFYVVCPGDAYSLDELNRLRGAEVNVRGVAFRMSESGNPMNNFLQLFDVNGLSVVRAAPDAPFADFRRGQGPSAQRQISGVVLAATTNLFLIAHVPQPWRVSPLPGQEQPRAGQLVTVLGYLYPFSRNLTLCDALVRIDRHETSLSFPPAEAVALTELMQGHTAYLPVKIVGLMDAPPAQSGPNTIVRLNCGVCTVDIDITPWRDTLGRTLEPDCVLEVSGHISPEFGNGIVRPLARIERLLMIPRQESDIRVISRPPWWTPARLLVLLCVVLAVLFLSVVWNVSLKTLSERRGRSLLRERLAHERAEAKIQERTHLAVEIHDTISQTLTGVALQVDAAVKANDKHREEIGRQHLASARQLLASCRHELRCCLWDLRNRTFKETSLTETIGKMLAPLGDSSRIAVRFNVPRRLMTDSVSHAVLRIVQELATNAVRHGQAAHVRVAGEAKDGSIRFSVTDDGCGFDPAVCPGAEQGHFGLLGIRERTASIGGSVRIDSRPGKGTKVVITIPHPVST